MTRLGQIIPKPRPKIPADQHSRLPFIGMDHIDADSFHLVGQDEFAKMKSAGSYFQEGDVLYGRLRPYLNKVHRAKFEGVASAEFIVLPASDFFDGEFIKYLLHRKKFVDFAMSRSSGDRPRVKFDGIAEFEFPLPPLNEQRRIVEKIETLFARLDQGEAALRHTQTLLARYRQSVLKAAVTGALTADWRAANAHRLEHGRDLLARILQIRRETWQGRGKYQEPAAPDTSNLPELPAGWVWATVEQVSGVFRNGLSRQPVSEPNDFPILRISSVRAMNVAVDDLRYYQPSKDEEVASYWVESGDLLFTRYNGSAHLVGVCGQMRERRQVLHPDKLIKVRPVALDDLNADYLEVAWNTGMTRKHIASNIKTTSGQQGVAGADIKAAPFPLPPSQEQSMISEMVWEAFNRISAMQAWCQTELTRSAALRQSILKDAFAGKLVPQDPTDEPAADLLARIRATRPTPSGRVGKAQRAHAEPTTDDR